MKRMVLVLTVALMMAAMLLVMAAPAFARGGSGVHYISDRAPFGDNTFVGGQGGSFGPGSGGGCGIGPFLNGGGGGFYCS